MLLNILKFFYYFFLFACKIRGSFTFLHFSNFTVPSTIPKFRFSQQYLSELYNNALLFVLIEFSYPLQSFHCIGTLFTNHFSYHFQHKFFVLMRCFMFIGSIKNNIISLFLKVHFFSNKSSLTLLITSFYSFIDFAIVISYFYLLFVSIKFFLHH